MIPSIMSTMNEESLSLSLRAWPEVDPSSKNLSTLIPLLQLQKGKFKDVHESALEEDLAAATAASGQLENPDTSLSVIPDPQQPLQQQNPRQVLLEKRQEMLNLIRQAQNEALYALDFVSLLLSSVRPVVAELSMSPSLKELVQVGTLGADRIKGKSIDSDESTKKVVKGWKSEALDTAAKSLLSASNRLDQEAEREARFWNDVVKVKDAGWAVCRLADEPQNLGIKYGFVESGADTKYTGLGALRKGVDGEVQMDERSTTIPRDKVIRLQIRRKGVTTGMASNVRKEGTGSVIEAIQSARDLLFENELFLEMVREARILANLGITTSEESVTIDFGDENLVLIERIHISDESNEDSGDGDNKLAEALLMSLQILLSQAHRHTLHRRRRPQPPLTQRAPPNLPLFILRPLGSQLSHRKHIKILNSFLKHIIAVTNSTGLQASFTNEPFYNCLAKPITNVEQAVECFLGLLETKYTIDFPGHWKITVLVHTLLEAPLFGTKYITQISHDGSCAMLMGSNTFSASNDMQRYLQWCLERSVVNELQNSTRQWRQVAMVNEMSKSSKGNEYKRLRVEVDDGSIAVRWTTNGGLDDIYTWKDNKTKPEKTIYQVLEAI